MARFSCLLPDDLAKLLLQKQMFNQFIDYYDSRNDVLRGNGPREQPHYRDILQTSERSLQPGTTRVQQAKALYAQT